jgi:antitoxin HicB
MPEGKTAQKIRLVFFRTNAGSEPVRDWLKGLDQAERHAVGRDLLRSQWRWPVGMPLCRPMGRGLWEVRTDLPGQPYRPRLHFAVPGLPRGIARVYQENANHPKGRLNFSPQAPEGVTTVSKKNMGSSIDDFLKKENIFEESQAQAIKEVVAWQLAKAMKKKKISKARMATLLRTSRSQVDRILDPKHDITLSSLQRAAALVGHRVMIELV